MKIDLRKIARSGKDEESFFFEFFPEGELLDIPSAKVVLPVKVSGSAVLTGAHSAFVRAEICFTVDAPCTRCLKETEKTFVEPIEEEFEADNPDSYPVINDTIDLSQMVKDKIITAVPVNFLCKEDCKGLCLNCGANLNDGDCRCEK